MEERKRTTDGDARAECVLVEEKLIVIPAKAHAYGPLAQANHVFYEGGLLQVGPPLIECRKSGRGAIVELRGVGDGVAEVFVEEGCVGFNARLQLLNSAMKRD